MGRSERIWISTDGFGLIGTISLSMSIEGILTNSKRKWLVAESVPNMGWWSSIQAEGDRRLSGALFSSLIADEYPL